MSGYGYVGLGFSNGENIMSVVKISKDKQRTEPVVGDFVTDGKRIGVVFHHEPHGKQVAWNDGLVTGLSWSATSTFEKFTGTVIVG